jgi:hypothetical protein
MVVSTYDGCKKVIVRVTTPQSSPTPTHTHTNVTSFEADGHQYLRHTSGLFAEVYFYIYFSSVVVTQIISIQRAAFND